MSCIQRNKKEKLFFFQKKSENNFNKHNTFLVKQKILKYKNYKKSKLHDNNKTKSFKNKKVFNCFDWLDLMLT